MGVYANFVAFDLETTGLDENKHQIIEVAGVKFTLEQQGKDLKPKIIDTFSSLVKPTMMIPEEASRVNGITNEMVEDAPDSAKVLKDFTRFCGLNTFLVAHNAEFDRKFLRHELLENQLMLPQNPVLDSLRIARKIMPEAPRHRLIDLAKRLRRQTGLQIEEGALHRALYDCEVLAAVWVALLRKRYIPKDLEMASFLKKIESTHGAPLFLTQK
jgi:DNA polymerase III epsilon subunit family exonuclease